MATRFITVSIEIMHDKNLTANQKFILAEIEQLSELEKGCTAGNEHFSKLIGIAKESVSRSINDLEKKGYISIEVVNGTRNHVRIISLNKTSNPVLTKHQETKENKTNTANQDLTASELETKESFNRLWKDYSLTFLKEQNRRGGSKAKAYKKYQSIKGKGISSSEIYSFVENHAQQKIGHKDLERLLTIENFTQYQEDN